jgi:hypothetical protein
LAVAELRQQEAEMNAALAAAIPVGMPRGGLEIAIDTHDEPFYGKTPELRAYTCKTRAKAGTTHFFRIASAYVIWREVRLTLALTYVLPEDDLPGVVERLLQRLGHLGLHATVAYLDKGFCSGEILRYLQRTQQAAAGSGASMSDSWQNRGHSRLVSGTGKFHNPLHLHRRHPRTAGAGGYTGARPENQAQTAQVARFRAGQPRLDTAPGLHQVPAPVWD